MASSGFLHTDMIGQEYLCFLLVKSAKLNLVKMETNIKTVFKSTYSLSAKDAVVLNVSGLLDSFSKLFLFLNFFSLENEHDRCFNDLRDFDVVHRSSGHWKSPCRRDHLKPGNSQHL